MNTREVEASTVSVWLKEDSVRASLDNCPFLYEMYKAGQIKPLDFSEGVKIATQLALPQVSATDASGTAMTVLSDQVLEYARADWKTVPLQKAVEKEAFDVEKSKHKKVSWLMSEFESVQSSILNTVEAMCFGDGTGDSGYAVDGLAAAISKTPDVTVYGGIDPTVVTSWKNLAVNGLDAANPLSTNPECEAGQPMSKTNILPRVRALINRLALNGKSPTHIFIGNAWYDLFESAIEEKERLVNQGYDGDAGFRSFVYKGVKVVNAGGLKRRKDGAYVGLADNEMYVLDIKDIHLFYHKIYESKARELGISSEEINAIVYPEAANGMILNDTSGSLNYYFKMLFKGNLLLGDRQRHAVFFEEA